jgi:hypothetical protein
MLLLGNMQATQRFAAFLVNLSSRYEARGYSPHTSSCACRAKKSATTWA